jgi:ribonuclease E
VVWSAGLTPVGCGPAVDGAGLAGDGAVVAGPGAATRAAASGDAGAAVVAGRAGVGGVVAGRVGAGAPVVAGRVGVGGVVVVADRVRAAGAETRGMPVLAPSKLAADAAMAAGEAGCTPADAVRACPGAAGQSASGGV